MVAPHGLVNLLGREFMTALRTAIEPHGDGMNAKRLSETGDIFIKEVRLLLLDTGV